MATKSNISEADRLELSLVTIMSQMQTSLSNNTKKILDSNGKIQELIKSLPMNKVKTKDTDDQSSQINSLKSQKEQLKIELQCERNKSALVIAQLAGPDPGFQVRGADLK